MKPRVTFLPSNRTSHAGHGATILDAADWIGIAMDGTCGGRGTCGKCKVRFLDSGPPITTADAAFLSPAQLNQGWRLACRAMVSADCSVEVPPAPAASVISIISRAVRLSPNVHKIPVALPEPSLEDPRADSERLRDALREKGHHVSVTLPVLRGLPLFLRQDAFRGTAVICGEELIALEAGNSASECLGLALDVGTTTIAAALLDLHTGATLAAGSARNAQSSHGADVIERISYTINHRDGLAVLQRAVMKSIRELTGDLLAASGSRRSSIYEVIAVGNTTMLHLLLGIAPEAIAVAPFIPVFEGGVTVPAFDIGLGLHPRARLTTLPHIGAYVGADAVSGLLATNLLRHNDGKCRLYID